MLKLNNHAVEAADMGRVLAQAGASDIKEFLVAFCTLYDQQRDGDARDDFERAMAKCIRNEDAAGIVSDVLHGLRFEVQERWERLALGDES